VHQIQPTLIRERRHPSGRLDASPVEVGGNDLGDQLRGERGSDALGALDLGETVCIPGLDDPAAVEHYHNTARQLIQASGRTLARWYECTGNGLVPAPPVQESRARALR
jgi:hypothetical protein